MDEGLSHKETPYTNTNEAIMKFAGIDPGKGGALYIESNNGIIVANCPLVKGTRDYDLAEMDRLVKIMRDSGCIVGLEFVHAFPGQGVVSMFSMGRGLGLWEALLVANGVTYQMVDPRDWRNFFELDVKVFKAGKKATKEEKDLAKRERKRLSQEFAEKRCPGLFKSVDQAEAYIISQYVKRNIAV